MVYTYTPTYYSTIHDKITSLCKTVLPFSLKNRRLPNTSLEQKLAKRQSDNLKWQQESFHRLLNLIGLHKEGITAETEVSAFRSHLIDTLIASPSDREPITIIRDKLVFLQDLLYAKCISENEYHSSKRPLLQRLAVQGAEIECRDVIVAGPMMADQPEEEWSVIELKDEDCIDDKESQSKARRRSPMKKIKSAISFYKSEKGRSKNDTMNRPSLDASNTNSILMNHCSPPPPIKTDREEGMEKVKRKGFQSLIHREVKDGKSSGGDSVSNSGKKQWGFDGFKKWKKSSEDESTTPYLPPGERSDDASSVPCMLVASPIGEGPDTKRIKKVIHPDGSSSDFFLDKVLGENIKKELSQIQAELCSTNQNLSFSNDQIEAISTRLPVDKDDLKKFFPKSWCDRYGDVVLDVVKKEFKDHVGEMETLRNAAKEKSRDQSAGWVAFGDNNDENCHPNLFSNGQASYGSNGYNYFANGGNDRLKYESSTSHYQNPFWNSSGH
ncbi:hypothetical protein QJS04_geneDACA005343 [Acorus gramineus]|uniref:Uncharacterized protein n=1 Tax=Acorus gramineus TaxID=55184 RepID=A0AAV9AWK7_ACOGR|nr:hypothetical protein QJS04_geneDACA005343 [Acorus gramineus]